jgi:hypothetical protein
MSIYQKISGFVWGLPSIAWVVILPLLLAGFIGGIIAIFWGIATVEGFASVVLLVIAILVISGANTTYEAYPVDAAKKAGKGAGFALAVGISFFALMGMSVDQTGNYLYNKPLDLIYCTDDTRLVRGVIVTNPVPGRTDINQDFNCVNDDDEVVKSIPIGKVFIYRFIQYVILGYILVYGNKIIRTIWAVSRKD